MNKDLVAKYGVVFGHYDSRGGTLFVSITEPTAKDVKGAMEFYNKEFFGYDEVEDVAYNAGVGREVDRIADKLVRGGEDPATSDYLYVARLYYREGTWPEGSKDLETDGFVLEAFKDADDHPKWAHGPQPPYVTGAFRGAGEGPEYGSDEWKQANKAYFDWQEKYHRWVKTPPFPVFNLEYVQVGELEFPGFPEDVDVQSTTEEEFAAKSAKIKRVYEEWEQEKLQLARSKALTEFGKAATEVPRWDDDAFGFLVIR